MTLEQNPTTLDYQSAKLAYHTNAQAKRDARRDYRAAMEKRANARFQAAKAMAVAFTKHRAAPKAVEESKILAKADAAHHELEADMADAEVKSALARLEELEGERATIRQLADWAREES